MGINLKETLENSKQTLLLLAEQLKSVEIEELQDFELTSKQFRATEIYSKVESSILKNDSPIIYIIELLDHNVRKKLLETFKNFSIENKSKIKNETRVNHSKNNTRDSATLYVGSSITDFRSRLKDHLGIKKSIRTYALHLSKWDNDLDYTIRVRTYKLSKTERIVVELIEQQIWDQLQPVFGKRSGLL